SSRRRWRVARAPWSDSPMGPPCWPAPRERASSRFTVRWSPSSETCRPKISGRSSIVSRRRLRGGNLEVFSRLLGTPYLPDVEGAILFFEDLGERPYRLDRLITHQIGRA